MKIAVTLVIRVDDDKIPEGDRGLAFLKAALACGIDSAIEGGMLDLGSYSTEDLEYLDKVFRENVESFVPDERLDRGRLNPSPGIDPEIKVIGFDVSRVSYGKEAVERFVSLLPKQLGDACGPNSDLRFIAEALFAAFIEPIERRLEGGKLSLPGRLYENNVRDPEAPCEEFERGIPNGTPHDCDGDGHYLCAECVAWNGGRDG